ncbi:MAG: dihydrofolate reductase [Desulforhopalus sp.]|nr:dihydrofolate reductase [Desulforhopalus sp.]
MEKIIIAAMATNRTIGRNNTLPWHIPEELKLFKKVTMGCPMIMGRKTFDSLPGILPGRRHIVLTRNSGFSAAGAEPAASLAEAITLLERDNCERAFIIGGAQVFTEALAVTDSLRLTLLNREVEGDVFFPPFEENFVEVSRKEFPGREDFTVIEYQRKGEHRGGN